MNNLQDLKKDIKTEAERLGFAHMGIASAVMPPHYERFLDWIHSGRHAEMIYLSREDAVAKRGDPQQILAGCRSIICLAVPYLPPESEQDVAKLGKGRIAAYARTKDYHTVIWDKCSQLEDFIQSRTSQNVRLKSYVDTGPILERSYASLAGLGIPGKNTCLIIQGMGSYFFLAEILTDIKLPIDQPYLYDLCKSCRRCIEACPTGCILENHTIDAERCISYLTIENKGRISDDLKEKMGQWVFGCDICQMVCPHNTHIPEQPPILGSPCIAEFMDLLELFSYDEYTFDEKIGRTPLSRTKRNGLLRNAAIVLGNQKLAKALPVLQEALEREQDPVIKDSCRWAIHQIQQDFKTGSQKD